MPKRSAGTNNAAMELLPRGSVAAISFHPLSPQEPNQ